MTPVGTQTHTVVDDVTIRMHKTRTADVVVVGEERRAFITKNIGILMIEVYLYEILMLIYILDDIPDDRCIL